VIKELRSKINGLEDVVTHLQEQIVEKKKRGEGDGSLSARHEGLNEDIGRLWETINNLIHNTQEQFEKLRVEQSGSKQKTHSRHASQVNKDELTYEKKLTTIITDFRDESIKV
jgi:hypothetical protein